MQRQSTSTVLLHQNAEYNDCRVALGAGEAVIELASQTHTARAALITVKHDCVLLGYYQSYSQFCRESSRETCVRRITGGPTIALRNPWTYFTLVIPGVKTLAATLEHARRTAECLYGSITGPFVKNRGNIGVIGATVLGDMAVIEIASTGPPSEHPSTCLSRQGMESRAVKSIPEPLARTRSSRYHAPSWNKYSFNPATTWAKTCRNGYWVRIGIETVDGYIAEWSLEGLFYAAPPPEIHSVLASVKGSPFHEIILESISEAIKARVEVAGIRNEDIVSVIKELYRRTGIKQFT